MPNTKYNSKAITFYFPDELKTEIHKRQGELLTKGIKIPLCVLVPKLVAEALGVEFKEKWYAK